MLTFLVFQWINVERGLKQYGILRMLWSKCDNKFLISLSVC